MSKWAGFQANTNEYHVVPLYDLVEHDLSDYCICFPSPELVKNAVGADCWLYSHSSLDGRELTEKTTTTTKE